MASSLFLKAVSRQREKCGVVTEYTHLNLGKYLEDLLPKWRVVIPTPGSVGISCFPVASEVPEVHAKELEFLATYLGTTVEEAKDQWEGHCETCAVFYTGEVLRSLQAFPDTPVETVLSNTYASTSSKLAKLPWEGAVEEMFPAEKRARAGGGGRTEVMWAPLLTIPLNLAPVPAASGGAQTFKGDVKTAEGTVAATSYYYLAGSPELPSRLSEAVAHGVGRTCVVPLYILNYIYDGDELSKEDLCVEGIETAQYSCHVVGLVLDGREGKNTCFVCDPNGSLVPGANMEFLSLPFTSRPGRASTAVSQFDLDEKQTLRKSKKKARNH